MLAARVLECFNAIKPWMALKKYFNESKIEVIILRPGGSSSAPKLDQGPLLIILYILRYPERRWGQSSSEGWQSSPAHLYSFKIKRRC